jgi:hypothetical protein
MNTRLSIGLIACVACGTACDDLSEFKPAYAVGGSITGLTSSGLVLACDCEPDLLVPSGATSFVFAAKRAAGSAYSVTVRTQPAGLVCNLLVASGVVASADVLSIAVNCGEWQQVAAGQYHTVALKRDGTLWAWGNDWSGQLGDGTTTAVGLRPMQVGSDSDWASVAAGQDSTVAIKSGGTLWEWGAVYCGQRCGWVAINQTEPRRVGTDTDWVSIAAGYHTVSLKRDGTLWAWGDNSCGQLGDGTTTEQTTPKQVGPDTDWASVAAGWFFTVAVKTDGTLWAWGSGQLGDGTATRQTTPKQVGTASDWASVAAGFAHTVAIKTDGTLWTWGSNTSGELGQATTTVPKQVGTHRNWASTAVARGFFGFTVAVKTDGTLWAWGGNWAGQLGYDPSLAPVQPVPLQVGPDTDWASVAAGSGHTVALKRDGTLWAWGSNDWGQLGDGTTAQRWTPQQVDTGVPSADAAAAP